MAVRNIAVTDTLETFRTEFNDLANNDFGDIANLSGSISSTNLVDAMNETISIATSTAGWSIEDSSSTRQLIGGGDLLTVLGTSNEIEAVVSATDTLTIGLPDVVSITTSVTAPTVTGGSIQITGNTISVTDSTELSFGAENITTTGTLDAGAITGTSITGSGATHTLGTIQISGNEISSTDSSRININDTFRATVFESETGLMTIDEISGFPRIRSLRGDNFLVFSAIPVYSGSIIFEGATADAFETTISPTDPTADRTITIPDNSGTIITTGSTDAVVEGMMAPDSIGQNELKTLSTLQILNSSGTVLKTVHGAGA